MPYTTWLFFFVAFAVVILIYAGKSWLRTHVPFTNLISALTLAFIFAAFENPWIPLLAVTYQYGLLLLQSNSRMGRFVWLGAIASALPMILVKLSVGLDVIAFAGLSFMTFRAIEILVDCDPKNVPTPLAYLAFLLFPPTLLAGPVDRYNNFSEHLNTGYDGINAENAYAGWYAILIGLLLKFMVAGGIDHFWLPAKIPPTPVGFLKDMYAYAAYLYTDFAGYSALAIGLALVLGFKLPENFRKPFLSVNMPDFFRRWNISLSEWLRDFVFQPLYQALIRLPFFQRHRLAAQNISIYGTFQLMGLWNGIDAKYVISGGLFGAYSAIHNTYVMSRKRRPYRNKGLARFLSTALTVNAACFALYVFSGRLPELKTLDWAWRRHLMHQGSVKHADWRLWIHPPVSISESSFSPPSISLIDADKDYTLLMRVPPEKSWSLAADNRIDLAGKSFDKVEVAVQQGWTIEALDTLPTGNFLSLDGRQDFYVKSPDNLLCDIRHVESGATDLLGLKVEGLECQRTRLQAQCGEQTVFKPISLASHRAELMRGQINLKVAELTGANTGTSCVIRAVIFETRLRHYNTNLAGTYKLIEIPVKVP